MDATLNEQPRFIEVGSEEEAEARGGLIPTHITRISLRAVVSTELYSQSSGESPGGEHD
jgi:hypothetical protein